MIIYDYYFKNMHYNKLILIIENYLKLLLNMKDSLYKRQLMNKINYKLLIIHIKYLKIGKINYKNLIKFIVIEMQK